MKPGNSDNRNNKIVIGTNARLARRASRRLVQGIRSCRLSFKGVPILFANSFPKSGTHLLTQVMHGFTRLGPAVDSGLPAIVTFDGFTGRQRNADEILADLHRLLPGDIAYGHVHALPEAVDFLCSQGVACFFILRDPRDVVVSHVHYIAEMAPNHIHHRYYHEVLQTFDERLNASIAGVPVEELAKATHGKAVYEPLPDIYARFEPYLGWLDRKEILVLRYEDFVTSAGEGEPAALRQTALKSVLEHALQRGFPIAVDPQAALQILEKSINPQRSPTFRSGKAGGWRDAFTPAHDVLFKACSRDLLTRLGYEIN